MPSMMNPFFAKAFKSFGILCIAFLSFASLSLSSCNSDDKEIEISNTENNHSLPVVKITIDEKYLWSEDSGLFVAGTGSTENYLQKWEFPAYLSYYEFGEKAFTDTVGFRIKGHRSRHLPNKSIGLYWRSLYGRDILTHTVFKNNPVKKFERLKLHNGGSHGAHLLIRTASILRIIEGHTLLDFSSVQPVMVYINKDYWGLYILNEMITPHYFKYKYNLSKNNINILKSDAIMPVVDDGSSNNWINTIIPFLKDNDLSDTANYEIAIDMIDKELLIDYFIIETYILNRDWPIFNMSWWNSTSGINEFNKWRYIIYDLDTSFEDPYSKELWLGDFYNNSENTVKNYSSGFFVFNAFMKNKSFRIAFFERYLYFINSVFTEDNVRNKIDELTTEIGVEEYNRHIQRWDIKIGRTWLEGMESLNTFNKERREWIKPIIEAFLKDENNG